MPVAMNGHKYYRTVEVCRAIGISRTTFFRWLKGSVFEEAKFRDRRGWRLFTEEELDRMKTEANRIIQNS